MTPGDAEPTLITVLEEPVTHKFPEPVFHGLVRNSKSGQDMFYLMVSDVFAGAKKPPTARKIIQRQLKEYLATSFFMGARLWTVAEDAAIQPELLELERTDPERSNCFAFGIVYSRAGQKTCAQYWDNEHGSPEFDRFLRLLGDKIELKGWSGFRGGLDVANDSKGTHSIYTNFQGKFEIMFHVSTLLPFHPADPLKLVRARQIQNDVVMIIFQEGLTTYDPDTMPTKVAHIFAVVQPMLIGDELCYRLGCVSKSNVSMFRPDIPYPPVFQHDNEFRNFLLTKLINGQIAARKSGLSAMFTRPRQALIQEIVTQFKPAHDD
jgi:hypothetical protein